MTSQVRPRAKNWHIGLDGIGAKKDDTRGKQSEQLGMNSV